MNVLIVHDTQIPVKHYGGTERVIWYLGKELNKLGHKVTYLVSKGSTCPFAKLFFINPSEPILSQIPDGIDIVHFHLFPLPDLTHFTRPYVITMHGNMDHPTPLNHNTIFVSKDHATRFDSSSYVYNGLDWDDYRVPVMHSSRSYFHFLGKAAWRVKNVKGAIDIIKKTKGEKLMVLGGNRLNLKMGFRFTTSSKVSFPGYVEGEQKNRLLIQSKGLVFPVRWHEPFGLAIIESLYAGCPVFGTPYGSLPELITSDFGHLSNKTETLVEALNEPYDRSACHHYALDLFNAKVMAQAYLKKYELVLTGKKLNISQPALLEKSNTLLAWE